MKYIRLGVVYCDQDNMDIILQMTFQSTFNVSLLHFD